MKIRIYALLFAGTLIAVAGGCAKQDTRVDNFYGTSYDLAKQSQIANPQAGIQDGPALGMEGDVASRVIDRYRKGFDAPAAKTERYSVSAEGIEVVK
jgi:hypothetical protein